jgi:AcrR family transcriptional regulator
VTRRPEQEQGLSIDEVVDATVSLLDEQGLQAFSMRSLGVRLGCSAMAPYRHVANRRELLRLAVARVEPAPPELGDGPWPARLERLMRDEWAYTWPAHPWLVEIWQQGLLDPRASRRLAVTLEIYRNAGFDSTLDRALLGHWSFIVGTLAVICALHATSDHMFEASDDDIFEFNLKIYIAGVRANGRRPSRGSRRVAGHSAESNSAEAVSC